MRKVQRTTENLPETEQRVPANVWTVVITVIKALGRWLRPPTRKREITYRTKQQTRDGYTEKEITYKDEY